MTKMVLVIFFIAIPLGVFSLLKPGLKDKAFFIGAVGPDPTGISHEIFFEKPDWSFFVNMGWDFKNEKLCFSPGCRFRFEIGYLFYLYSGIGIQLLFPCFSNDKIMKGGMLVPIGLGVGHFFFHMFNVFASISYSLFIIPELQHGYNLLFGIRFNYEACLKGACMF